MEASYNRGGTPDCAGVAPPVPQNQDAGLRNPEVLYTPNLHAAKT